MLSSCIATGSRSPPAQRLSRTHLLCPSRGRPSEALDLLRTFWTTTTDAQISFLVDDDDPTRGKYPQEETLFGPPTGDPTGPLNREALASDADIVGFIGDDSRLLTPGWDDEVREALTTPGFCWGFDGTNQNAWPSTCFVSRSIIQALGYFVPPTLRRGYFDVAWVQLATRTKTDRIIPALFPHDNSRGDPSKPNYDPAFRVPPEVIAQDERAFNEWMRDQMPRDVHKLRQLIYR